MRIGALSYSPYIYNTNYISANSMGKVAPIEDDLTAGGVDYSSLTDDSLNENPLQKGETSNFADVLAMQFHMAQMNASRLIKPAEEMGQTAAQDERREQSMGVQEVATEPLQKAESVTDLLRDTDAAELLQDLATDGADDVLQVSQTGEASSMQMERNLFAMQRAAEAYRVQMIA